MTSPITIPTNCKHSKQSLKLKKLFFLLIYVLPESIIYLTWFHGFCEKRQKLLLSRQSGLAETTKEIFQPMEMCPLQRRFVIMHFNISIMSESFSTDCRVACGLIIETSRWNWAPWIFHLTFLRSDILLQWIVRSWLD